MRHLGILLLCTLFSACALAEVTITRTDPLFETKIFDPLARPAAMPKLNPNESAVTQSFFGADTRVGGEIIERKPVDGMYEVTIKVDTVRMILKMQVNIWLPRNHTPKLIKHEEGHRELAERFYKDADKVAQSLAEALIGQTITGRGPDPDAAANAALKEAAQVLGGKYLGKTDVPCGKTQELYDQITSHGTNAVPEERAIGEAIRRVKAE